jgi:regulator of replication initiation timing
MSQTIMNDEAQQLIHDLRRENEALSLEVDHLRMGLRLCKQACAAKLTLEEWVAEFRRLEPQAHLEEYPAVDQGIRTLYEGGV